MTIRTRLSCWSAGLMLAALASLLGFCYFEFVHEHPEFLAGSWTAQKQRQLLHSVEEVTFFAGFPFLILAGGGIWWLFFVRRSLKPLEELTLAAERMDVSRLKEPFPRTGNQDEIDRLAAVLNEANRRVDDAFHRVREFTLHASHELKTPLTVLRAGLESDLRDENLTAAQRDQLVDHLAEIDRLAHIVEALTFLTRADSNLLELRWEELRLDDLVRDAVEDAQVLAEPRAVQVTLTGCVPAVLRGDRHRLRQLLLNLTDNAVKYNVAGGRVEIGLDVRGGEAFLTMANTGPGLAPELQSRVFDRFFRGDPSHNKETEGCGLGLSIAQWIVRAHRGEVTLTSTPGQLTTVSVRLPGATPAEPRPAEGVEPAPARVAG